MGTGYSDVDASYVEVERVYLEVAAGYLDVETGFGRGGGVYVPVCRGLRPASGARAGRRGAQPKGMGVPTASDNGPSRYLIVICSRSEVAQSIPHMTASNLRCGFGSESEDDHAVPFHVHVSVSSGPQPLKRTTSVPRVAT